MANHLDIDLDRDHERAPQSGPNVVRRAISRSNPPPRASGPLSSAAIDADARASLVVDLAEIWHRFAEGCFSFHSAGLTPTRQYVLACTGHGEIAMRPPLSARELTILPRFMSGEQQKYIAGDSGIACSTTSKWCTEALKKLNLGKTVVPLPLVVAAQRWTLGRAIQVDAWSGLFEFDGTSYFLLSVPRPVVRPAGPLSPSEREITQRYIEGESRWEIARARATTIQTVACQLRAISNKLDGTSGRYALIRLAADRGWFRSDGGRA